MKRLCLLLGWLSSLAPAELAAAGPAWQPTAALSVRWHDNVTNADVESDIRPGLELQTEIAFTRRQPLNRDNTLLFGAAASAESWPRFDGLDRTGAGVRLAWLHKFGLGAYAPVLGLESAGDLVAARESGRAGRRGFVAVTARYRLATYWQIRGRHERTRYDGRAHAFDRTGREDSGTLEYDLATGWRASVTGAVRHGGVLSYATPPRPDLLREGKPLTVVTTFDRNTPMVAYYFLARTVTTRAELAHQLTPDSSLHLTVEQRDTSRGPIGYVNRVVAVEWAHRF